jgi:hypothetical protein
MGSLDIVDSSGPALPDTAPMSIRELACGLAVLFSKADGLALPGYITIHGASQAYGLQFAGSEASYEAVTSWALRFGAVLASDDHTGQDGQLSKYVRATFDFSGVEVQAYAFIPVTATGT